MKIENRFGRKISIKFTKSLAKKCFEVFPFHYEFLRDFLQDEKSKKRRGGNCVYFDS